MTDEGLKFFATVRKRQPLDARAHVGDGDNAAREAMGEAVELHRETDDRAVLLEWIATHCAADDELAITIEATGAAARRTLAALAFGARQMGKSTR